MMPKKRAFGTQNSIFGTIFAGFLPDFVPFIAKTRIIGTDNEI